MQREVIREQLDFLPEDDLRVVKNRRDLQTFNRLFGSRRWFARSLLEHLRSEDKLLEIGAGDGSLIRDIRQQVLPRFTNDLPAWHLLELKEVPPCEGPGFVRHLADVRVFPSYADFTVILGNMFLHQMQNSELAHLGKQWNEHARLLIFQETWRQPFALWGAKLLTLPMSPVSRHDAAVSVRAGFRKGELGPLLGLDPVRWQTTVTTSIRGVYRFIACRK
jgi:hypothetical protein